MNNPKEFEWVPYTIDLEVAGLREYILFVDSRIDAIDDLCEERIKLELPGYQVDRIIEEGC